MSKRPSLSFPLVRGLLALFTGVPFGGGGGGGAGDWPIALATLVFSLHFVRFSSLNAFDRHRPRSRHEINISSVSRILFFPRPICSSYYTDRRDGESIQAQFFSAEPAPRTQPFCRHEHVRVA